MAIPLNARAFSQPLDPTDRLDFSVQLSQGHSGDTPEPLLLTGEGVASFTLAATPEATAAGLQILSGTIDNAVYPAPTISALVLYFWIGVVSSAASAAAFSGSGSQLAIELTIVTDSVPPRRKQRTLVFTVQQQ